MPVLTKKGPRIVKEQDEFKITKFAIDDEIDYILWDVVYPNGSNYYETGMD